jgi:hypothetical protein
VVCKRKFKADKLQKSYAELADFFGATKAQSKVAINLLCSLNLVTKEFREVKLEGGRVLNNVLFLEPVSANISMISESKLSFDTDPPSLSIDVHPSPSIDTESPSQLTSTLPPQLTGTLPPQLTQTYTENTTESTSENTTESTGPEKVAKEGPITKVPNSIKIKGPSSIEIKIIEMKQNMALAKIARGLEDAKPIKERQVPKEIIYPEDMEDKTPVHTPQLTEIEFISKATSIPVPLLTQNTNISGIVKTLQTNFTNLKDSEQFFNFVYQNKVGKWSELKLYPYFVKDWNELRKQEELERQASYARIKSMLYVPVDFNDEHYFKV